MSKHTQLVKAALIGVLLCCSNPHAQELIPFHSQKYSLDSRAAVQTLQATGQATEDESTGAIFAQTIQVPGANWLRLQFGDHDLGDSGYIVMTSMEDGGRQRMDAPALVNYRHRSAFFNGDRVLLQVFDPAGRSDRYITVTDVYYGLPGDAEKAQEVNLPALDQPATEEALVIQPEEICGSDDRVAADVPRATGRFVFFDPFNKLVAKCTAWIAAYGIHFSAGHCFQRLIDGDPDLMEFDVPLSDANGDPNFADPDDQYPVDVANFDAVADRNGNGLGDDWSVFRVNPNSNSGLRPIEGRRNFFHMAKAVDINNLTSITITGYGIDSGTANRTLQTDNGPYLGETGSASNVYLEYQVDTRSGNSGGPIITGSTSGIPVSLGIHTHAGCDADDGNHGTSFENNALESAARVVAEEFVEQLIGQSVAGARYVDVGHPVASAAERGTMLRPYDMVREATDAVANRGAVLIAPGRYSKAAGNTFRLGADGRRMFLLSPGGSVIIGN